MAKGNTQRSKRPVTKKKESIRPATGGSAPHAHFTFTRDNYKWMLIGLGVIVLGFILMAGPTDEIYNSSEALRNASFSFSTHMKITIAPIVVLSGFVIEVFAIMKKPKVVADSE